MTTNTKGSPAYFACPDCQKLSKVTETRQRDGWKYRRYTCPKGHSFSTREQAYTAFAGGADFIWRHVHAGDTPQECVDETDKNEHEWVELTMEEIFAISGDYEIDLSAGGTLTFARLIEAKLKEKNT